MTEMIVSDSLKNRRRTLHTQRRLKALRSLWRFSILSGLVGALIWIMSWPEWTIRDQSQIVLQGNQLLSDQQIYQLFPLKFPQSIWQISTRQISQSMGQSPALSQVAVSRQLFPAQLVIAVVERQPIAVATTAQGAGYLDLNGTFIPSKLYQGGKTPRALPTTLAFLGYGPQYQSFWQKNYAYLRSAPVTVHTINGTNPSNMMLSTDLGLVYLGANLSQFPQQLETLGKMKRLPGRVPLQRINYIDLTNPAQPLLQLKPPAPKSSQDPKVKKS
ncbi:FtsQ-type POTRA domain-containing protein [Synechocystis sp. LKSZ1]|uniref:cell division protein FtsQ/DivIB n=1 Tax=Synechocystis sp. LKSZ1 TaxID=3144951 RepID=UPI00336C0108